MFFKEVNAIVLLLCVSYVLSSEPNSEVESLSIGGSRADLEKQLKTTINAVKEEIEKMKKVMEKARNTLAENAKSDSTIQQLLQMHDQITNLTNSVLEAANPLKDVGP